MQDVETTMLKPTCKSTIDQDNMQKFIRKLNGKINIVVVEHKKGAIILITTYWAKGEEK